MRYVALGDSYTIGTSVARGGSLAGPARRRLGADEPTLELVANLGVNGYTSADLIREELPALVRPGAGLRHRPHRRERRRPGRAAATYEANVVTILDALLVRLPPDRIVTVAIPDYTVTPAGADYGDPAQQHDGIVATNAVMARLSAERGIAFVDIFDISLEAATDRSLVADDGLHPSGAQYARWVERIRPVVEGLLAP